MSIFAEEVVVWSSYFLERRHSCRDGLLWELTAPRHSFGRSDELIQIPAPKDYRDGESVFAVLLNLPGGGNERRVLFLVVWDLTVESQDEK